MTKVKFMIKQFLNRVDAVPWKDLQVARASTPNGVRDGLCLLASGSPDEQRLAVSLLEDALVRNLELKEASFFAITFLCELLDFDSIGVKRCAIGLLCDIAQSSAPIDQVVVLELDHMAYAPIAFKSPLPLQVACRAALLIQIPKYLKLLNDSDPDCRSSASYLLSFFCEFSHLLIPILEQALSAEWELETRRIISNAIQVLES